MFRDRMYYKEIVVSRSLVVRASITNCSCCNERLEKQPHERENRQQVEILTRHYFLMCCLCKSKLEINTRLVLTFSKSTVEVISSKFKKYREQWNRILHSFLVLLLLLRASKHKVNRYYKKIA